MHCLIGVFALFLTICNKCISVGASTRYVNVNITDGPIRGFVQQRFNVDINTFLGIPFAQPPVGELRFRAPQKPHNWTTVKDCLQLPYSCAQGGGYAYDNENPAARMWLTNTDNSEDCLYLNIWTPTVNANHDLAVIIWIFGGAYIQGSATLAVYDGSTLAAKENVIIVNAAHRLGPFGFLMFDNDEAPGNQAIRDQQMALQWVQDNIHQFGGDPARVTLMGESSGAASVSILAVSPRTRHLYRNAILQSGSFLARWALDSRQNAIAKAKDLARILRCDTADVISCLRGVDVSHILSAYLNVTIHLQKRQNYYLKHYQPSQASMYPIALYFDVVFRPVSDGHFVSSDFHEIDAQLSDKHFLIGTNRNEAFYFLLYSTQLIDDLLGINAPFNFSIETYFANTIFINPKLHLTGWFAARILDEPYMHPSYVTQIAHEYGIDLTKNPNVNRTDFVNKLDALAGDLDFKLPMISFAEKMVGLQSSVYVYEFDHKTKMQTWPDWVGVMHGYEIEYTMGAPHSQEFGRSFYNFTREEGYLSDVIMKYYANFAKYG